MRSVWKFAMDLREQRLEMPAGAEVVHVDNQGGGVMVWALCDPDAPLTARTFVAHPTGGDIPAPEGNGNVIFRGSALIDGGRLVWHIFEYTGDMADLPFAGEDGTVPADGKPGS